MAKQIAVSLLLAAIFSCDNEDTPHQSPLASPSAVATTLGIDAAALGIGLTDPERPAGDLAADLQAFTTVEACMKQHTASLDPLVGDAVDAIGYDTFLRDACRVLEAAKNKDGKQCDLIDSSALRTRCRSITAMVAGDPNGCPLKAPSKPESGRDATCVAAALRSPAMCAGAAARDRSACEALLGHDASKCDALVLPDQRAPCVRDARRFRGVLGGAAEIRDLPAPKGTLTLPQSTVDLESDVGAGVVVVVDGKAKRLTFGKLEDSVVRAVQPLEHAHIGVALTANDDKPAEVTQASLSLPGTARSSCAGDTCSTLTVKVTKLEPKRGGALDLVLDGTLGGNHVHAEIATFVRDVVNRADWR